MLHPEHVNALCTEFTLRPSHLIGNVFIHRVPHTCLSFGKFAAHPSSPLSCPLLRHPLSACTTQGPPRTCLRALRLQQRLAGQLVQ